MKINTRDFGTLEIDPQEIIEFRTPIYGFENLKRFVLLYDDTVPGPFTWLQSIEDEKACFILVDPQAIVADYCPELPAHIQRLLEMTKEDACVLRTIAVIPEQFQNTTINLKSPIAINSRTKCAAQVILEEDYPIRARLMEESSC